MWREEEKLLSLESTIDMNGEILRISGLADSEGIRLIQEQGGKDIEVFIRCGPLLGPYLASQALGRALAEGQARVRYSSFSPETMTIEEVLVTFEGPGAREDSEGWIHRGLLAKERRSSLPGSVSSLVLNPEGRVLYSRTAVGLDLEVVRLDQPAADIFGEPAFFELDALTMKLEGKRFSGSFLSLSWAEVRFSGLAVGELVQAFQAARTDLGEQFFEFEKTANTLTVRLKRAEPPPAAPLDLRGRTGPENTQSFHLDLTDSRLDELLESCSPPTIQCLQKTVYNYIVNKNGGHGFSGTAEILDSRAGGCTEHSVLLLSLLKKLSVPSRIAYGFALTGQGFSGHAWVEARVRDRWYWVDPSFPSASAQPLKIRVGVLDPVRPVWGQMNLSLLRILGTVKADLLEWSF